MTTQTYNKAAKCQLALEEAALAEQMKELRAKKAKLEAEDCRIRLQFPPAYDSFFEWSENDLRAELKRSEEHHRRITTIIEQVHLHGRSIACTCGNSIMCAYCSGQRD